jgi:uncharacterized protein YbjQ (UPF0145 family)
VPDTFGVMTVSGEPVPVLVVAGALVDAATAYESGGGRDLLNEVLSRPEFAGLYVAEASDVGLPRPGGRWTVALRRDVEAAVVVGKPGGGWKLGEMSDLGGKADALTLEIGESFSSSGPWTPLDLIVVTTTPTMEGRVIGTYLGLVFGEAISGAGLLSDTAAGFRDAFGGRASMYEDRLAEMRRSAVNQMVSHAAALRADAVVGVRVDYEVPRGSMLMATAHGTAVRFMVPSPEPEPREMP